MRLNQLQQASSQKHDLLSNDFASLDEEFKITPSQGLVYLNKGAILKVCYSYKTVQI